MAVGDLITLGIGTPSSIRALVLTGLSIGEPAAQTVYSLTTYVDRTVAEDSTIDRTVTGDTRVTRTVTGDTERING